MRGGKVRTEDVRGRGVERRRKEEGGRGREREKGKKRWLLVLDHNPTTNSILNSTNKINKQINKIK